MKLVKEHINEAIKHLKPRSLSKKEVKEYALKDKLIDKLMRTVYNDDDIKYYNITYDWLNTLSIKELEYKLNGMKKLVNESLKDELISRLMSTKFRDDDPEYKEKNLEYLESLTEDQLDEMLRDTELFNISYHK